MGHSKKALNEILFFLEPPRQKRLKQKDAQRLSGDRKRK